MGKDDTCLYKGHETKANTKMAIAIYDPKNKTLTLQATSTHIVQQSVPSYTNASQPEALKSTSWNAVFEDFGSSKKRKVLKSQQANRVNVSSVVGAGMVDSILEGDMSQSNRTVLQQGGKQESAVDAATREWRESFLPPFDESAEEAHDVYSLEKIMDHECGEYVATLTARCLAKDDVAAALFDHGKKPAQWTPSVKALSYKIISQRKSTLSSALKAAVLCNFWSRLYVDLQHRKTIPAPTEERSRYFGVPLPCAKRWLHLFTTPATQGFVMGKMQKQKCALFILMLYCMTTGIQSEDVKPLADDLRLDAKEAGDLLRQAGFTVKRRTGKMAASLKVPLTFPAATRGRR